MMRTPGGNRRAVWPWAAVACACLLVGVVWVRARRPESRERRALRRLERRGDLSFQAGRSAEAEAHWVRVLEADPDAAAARNKLAVLCINGGRPDEAGQLLEEGIRRAPGNAAFHYNLGLLRATSGDYPAALESLRRVERLNPGHGRIHLLMGMIYEKMGLEDEARREFVAELNVDPATPAAWAGLGLPDRALVADRRRDRVGGGP
jgi:Flp pilus assembly protein TadD